VLRAEPSAGLLLLCVGSAGLVWEARLVWLAAQQERGRRRHQAAREALATERRERTQRQRHQRQERRHVEERARAGQSAALRAQRAQANVAQQQQDERRARRQELREAAAERWLVMPADRLPTEVETLFVQRGFTPLRADGDSLCDLLLEEPTGRQTLARCLDHSAGTTDVQALDAWRRNAERSHAYLIALAGFSPQAVRLARSLPITLVEAHLLAAWQEKQEQLESTDFTDDTD
jgi:hypothetical protein